MGSEAFNNDTDIEEQPMDVEESRQSAMPPSPSLPSSQSAPLPQISNRAPPGGHRNVQADVWRPQVPPHHPIFQIPDRAPLGNHRGIQRALQYPK